MAGSDAAGVSDPAARRAVTPDEVAAQLRALGVAQGGVLLAHSSYRAARPVEGGPAGLIEGLRRALGPAGTLAMPSSTGTTIRRSIPPRRPPAPTSA